jgi:hypothetical protein
MHRLGLLSSVLAAAVLLALPAVVVGGIPGRDVAGGDRMQVAINICSARRGRLTIGSTLLSLAKIVRDQTHVPD